MKSCSRNKFLLCFRPSEIDPDDQITDFIDVPRMISNSSVCEKKSSLRRSFSVVFKSNVGQTNLSKRDRDIQRSKSYGQLSSDFDETVTRNNLDSPTSTLCLGPTPGSSFGSYDHHEPGKLQSCLEEKEEVIKDSQEEKGISQKLRREGLRLNHVMYLVVLSLLFTVLWGKSLAVVITTVSIFFVRIVSQGMSLEKLCTSVGFLLEISSCSGFCIPPYFK